MPAARSANAVSRAGLPIAALQLRQRRLRIAHQAERVRVAAAELQRIDVDLHHLGVERRNAPGVRHLIAGVAADEQHKVRLVHDLVGGRRGIVSRATNRQAMPRRDHAAPAERGADRRRQRLAQRQQFRPGTGRGGTGAGDDDDALRRAQLRRRALDLVVRRRRAIRRHRQLQRRIGAGRFAHHAGLDDVRRPSVQVEMRRTRRARHRLAPGLAQQARQVGGVGDIGRELRHRCVERLVREFLIGVAMVVERRLAAGQRDHRAVAQIRVLQPRREVRRADRLREADAGAAGDARIAVGHVGGGLLGVRQHARDAERAKFDQRPPQHRIDEEHMRRAVRRQRARQPFGAGDRLRCVHAVSSRAGALILAPGCRRNAPRHQRPRLAGSVPLAASCAVPGSRDIRFSFTIRSSSREKNASTA